MLKRLLLLAALLPAVANAQSVQQSGNVTPGHAMCWATTGVAYDCGAPGGGISVVGSQTQNDFPVFNGSGSLVDSGINPTATSNITGLWNFQGGLTTTTATFGSLSGTQQILFSGTSTGAPAASYGMVQINQTDSGGANTNSILTSPLLVNLTLNGSSVGLKPGATFQLNVSAPTANVGNGLNFYTATSSLAFSNVADNGTPGAPIGYLYGANPTATLGSSGQNWRAVIGIDAISSIQVGGSAQRRIAVQAEGDVQSGGNAQGSALDTAYDIIAAPGAGFNVGFFFDDIIDGPSGSVPSNGIFPINAHGVLIQAGKAIHSQIMAAGFDLHPMVGAWDYDAILLPANNGGISWVTTGAALTGGRIISATTTGGGTITFKNAATDISNSITSPSVIQILTGVAPPSGGTGFEGYLFTSTSDFGIFPGTSAPTLSAAEGSLYLRNDNGTAYVNTNGTTGWTQLASTASPTFSGTVTGPDSTTWTSSGWSALTATGAIKGQSLTATGAATTTASQTSIGNATTAAGSGNCPSGTVGGKSVAGCINVGVGASAQVIPYF